MNDQILSGYLEDFRGQHGLEKLGEPDLFAQFVTYCIIAKQTGSTTAVDELNVDGGQDTGIDALAILINDRVINDKEDIDYFRESGRLDVEFIFIQSKMASKFDSGDIGKFLFGVQNFFNTNPTVTPNEPISRLREIKDFLYKNSIQLKRAPICRLFYASTGKWTNDEFLQGRIEHDVLILKNTDLFYDVKFSAIDADRLKAIYRELRHRVEKEIIFEKHTILPKIANAEEAYLGILPSQEFLKLIMDDEGEILKSLFYDNVRDFQGYNQVNQEIAETLGNSEAADGFVILNNGVTIVAKSIKKIGASFSISDYQIVNGCQTSHVFYLNKDNIGSNVYLPIKLIVTNDPELANRIIKATNRQTEVKMEAFESLSPFHRILEEFYSSFGKDPDKRLYYERRSKQYANTSIKPTSIITLAAQAKSYLGMFINEPHSTHRYYGEILQSYRDRLFLESHSPYSYYAAGLALSRVESLFRSQELSAKLKPFKHHLLLMFRLHIGGGAEAPQQGKKAEEYAKKICEVLWDKAQATRKFKECAEELRHKIKTFSGDTYQADRLRVFTNYLLPSVRKRPQGKVKVWNHERGFGFVTTDDGRDIFVHYTAIREKLQKSLKEGEWVEFDITQTDRGPQAYNLRII